MPAKLTALNLKTLLPFQCQPAALRTIFLAAVRDVALEHVYLTLRVDLETLFWLMD